MTRTRLLWISVAVFVTDLVVFRFLNQYEWVNCVKVWVNTGGFQNCVTRTAPWSWTASLIHAAFIGVGAFLIQSWRESRSTTIDS